MLVLEATVAAGGATSAGMGHLVVIGDSPEQLALTALSLDLWRTLSPMLPSLAEYNACGTIWIAEDDAQMGAVEEKRRVMGDHGIISEVVSAHALAGMEPNLREGLAGGLLVPGDGVVFPPGVALWLLDQARAQGAVLRESCRVDEVLDRAVRCGDEVLEAEVIVNAAGAEAARLTPALSIVPRKGHLAITDRHPGFIRHQLVEVAYLASAHVMTNESVAFNVQPRLAGQVLIGSSRELVGWDASTNQRVLREMLDRALAFMPALAGLSIIRTWTGFRPATRDTRPLIGRWDATDGLWIAAGHEGLGITTSLGTARLLADLIVGRAPAIDPLPFSPMRVVSSTPAGP